MSNGMSREADLHRDASSSVASEVRSHVNATPVSFVRVLGPGSKIESRNNSKNANVGSINEFEM
jgi:hypothetical protein